MRNFSTLLRENAGTRTKKNPALDQRSLRICSQKTRLPAQTGGDRGPA